MKVIRKTEHFDLSQVYDEHAKEHMNLQALLDKIFLTNGRLFHHEKILCWFPKYLSHFVETSEVLMNREDVLPITWKYYIAIMAVSCYDCEYLVKILEEQFLLYGGDVAWLMHGLKKADKKLERLGELNELLAFKPWIISASHIENMVKGEEKDQKANWSIPEVL